MSYKIDGDRKIIIGKFRKKYFRIRITGQKTVLFTMLFGAGYRL